MLGPVLLRNSDIACKFLAQARQDLHFPLVALAHAFSPDTPFNRANL